MSIKEQTVNELKPLVSKNRPSNRWKLLKLIFTFSNYSSNSFKMNQLNRYFLFGINILTFFVYGLSLAAFGVSLQEYCRNINMDMKELSVGVSLSSVLGCISCLIAAYTLDKFNRQLQFGIFLIFYGLVTVIYPLATSYSVYLLNSALAGVIISYINSIPSIWVVELFPENPETYVQVLHFFFPIGEFVGPVLVAPFLNKSLVNDTSSFLPVFESDSSELKFSDKLYDTLFGVTETSDLWIPYMVITGLKWLIAILVLGSYLFKPYKKEDNPQIMKNSENEEFDAIKEAKHNLKRNYLLTFSIIVCLIVGLHWANEQNHYNYISTYLQKKKGLPEKTAAYGQSVLSMSITIGRLLNIFLTMCVKVQYMIFVNFTLLILGNFIMIISGTSISGAYASIVFIGLGFSSLYPFLISFVEERISMSNRMIAFMTFSAGIFQTPGPLLIGEYLEKTPDKFIVFNLAITTSAFALYIVLSTLEFFRLRDVSDQRKTNTYKVGFVEPDIKKVNGFNEPIANGHSNSHMNGLTSDFIESNKSNGFYESTKLNRSIPPKSNGSIH